MGVGDTCHSAMAIYNMTRTREPDRVRGSQDNLQAAAACRTNEEAARFFSHLGNGGAMKYERQVFAGLYQYHHVRAY